MRAARERGLIPTVCSGALRILHPAFYGSVVRQQHRKGTAAASRGRCAGWVGVLLAAALAISTDAPTQEAGQTAAPEAKPEDSAIALVDVSQRAEATAPVVKQVAVADSQIKVLSNAEVRGSLPDFPPAGPVPK